MTLRALRRKAHDGSLEVEHLLKAAKQKIPGLRSELASLSQELAWSMTPFLPDGSHVVPLAKWAEVAGAYAEMGMPGLEPLSRDFHNAPYVLGLLEELNSSEAVATVLELFSPVIHQPQDFPDLLSPLVASINLLMSVKGCPAFSPEQAALAREFLHKAIALMPEQSRQACVVYALRGVGDQQSIDLLSRLRAFEPPYANAKASAVRTIRARLRDK
jgi:hypothetical protein